MDNFEPYQIWLLMAAVAYAGYLFGRASVTTLDPHGREARRVVRQEEAERVFSALTSSNQMEVDRLLNGGKLIEAVKLIRADAKIGLKEAKNVADHRRRVLSGGMTP